MEDREEEYNKLIDKIAELRDKYLSIEWLDKQSRWALGEVVASPEYVLFYLDKYLEEILER